MLIDDFKRLLQRTEIETLSELQRKVLPVIYKVHPPCIVNEIRLDASERLIGIWFQYKGESYVAQVRYDYHSKKPYALIETYVAHFEHEISDQFVDNFRKCRDELELAITVLNSRMYTSIDNVELDTPERFASVIEELFQKRLILEKMTKNKLMKDEHLDQLLNSCPNEALIN